MSSRKGVNLPMSAVEGRFFFTILQGNLFLSKMAPALGLNTGFLKLWVPHISVYCDENRPGDMIFWELSQSSIF